MKAKIIVLLLFMSAVILSGCVGEEQQTGENITENETVTPGESLTESETATPEETVTESETATPEETVTENETVPEETETPEENVTEDGVEITTSTEPKTYTIRIQYYVARPSSLDIKVGDTLAWINLHDSPKRTFTLVSEDGLFENTTLAYRRTFSYTFNETGDYNFSVVGQPKMSVEVAVGSSENESES